MCTTNFGRINGRLVRKVSAGVKKKKTTMHTLWACEKTRVVWGA